MSFIARILFLNQDPTQDRTLLLVVMSLWSHLTWNSSSAFVFQDVDFFEEYGPAVL